MTRQKEKNWANINAFNIWQAEEVKNVTTKSDVSNSRENTFYLIVKDSVKVLDYYEPEYFEECKVGQCSATKRYLHKEGNAGNF